MENSRPWVSLNDLPLSGSLWILYLVFILTLLCWQEPARAGGGHGRRVSQQDITISGRVINEEGEPLAGVSIHAQGSANGVVTDAEGNYTLTVYEDAVLEITYVGFVRQAVEVHGKKRIDIRLRSSTAGLDEVVVVGYGTQKRSDLTGSISSISGDEIKKSPIASLDQGLEGRAPGVQITQNTGQPGGSSTVRIRGITSINAGNEPLYVIDGLPVYNNNADFSTGVVQSPDLNALATINPNDIESIEILKDASATAIYGSRGANGVVIITTKRGKAGHNDVSFDAYFGIQQLRHKLDLLDARGYAELVNDATNNYNMDNPGQPRPILYPDPASLGKGTDWQDALYRQTPVQNYQLTFSGGDERTQYAISGDYFDQQGIYRNSDFKRASVRINLDRKINERFKLGNNLTLNRVASNQIPNSIIGSAFSSRPTLPIKQQDGSYTLYDEQGNIVANPVAIAEEVTNKTTSYRLLGNIFGEYQILDGLTARVSFGGDIGFSKEYYYAPKSISLGLNDQGDASIGNAQSIGWLNENTLNYVKRFNDVHEINILGGITFQGLRNESVVASSKIFSNDILKDNDLGSAGEANMPSSYVSDWRLASYLSRINYSYKGRYLVTLTARSDGSSRFGSGNKYGFFPSGAFSWRISEEPFFRKQALISDLKLRTSYGITGNQEIPNYQSLSSLNSNGYIIGNTFNIGFSPAGIANPDLKWETTQQADAGLDIGLWRNKLNITADVYYKRTTNMLLQINLPYSSGYSSVYKNIGSMENKGLEVAINSHLISRQFSWTTNFNIAFNRNKVVNLGNQTEFLEGGVIGKITSTGIVRVGEPIGSFWGYATDGIYQSGDDIGHGPEPLAKPGDIRYVDIDGNGIINDNDRKIVGRAQPDFFGGFGNTFSYKNFELNIFLQVSYGNDVFNNTLRSLESPGSGTSAVLHDRWTPENPSKTIPRATVATMAQILTDRFIEDGSYLRVKNITLSYTLPTAFVHSVKIKYAKVYVTAQNAFTITKYTGYDPEVSSFNQANLAQGVDNGVYPSTKTFLIGINLGLQ